MGHHSRYDDPRHIEDEVRGAARGLRSCARRMRQRNPGEKLTAGGQSTVVRNPAKLEALRWGAEAFEQAAAILLAALERRAVAKEIERAG